MRPIFEDSRGRSDLPGSIWHSQNGCCDFPGLFGSLEWLNLAQNDNNTSVFVDIQNNPNYQSRCIDYDSPQAIYSEWHDHLPWLDTFGLDTGIFQVIRAFRVSKLGQKQQRYTRFCSEFKLPQIMNHNSWHIGDDSTNAICPHNFDHLTWIDTLRIDSDTLRVIGVLGMSKSRQKCRKIQPLLRSILMTPSGPMLAYFLAIFPQNIWALALIWFSRII